MEETTDKTAEKQQVVGRPFPKGISGNPAGRPKGSISVMTKLKQIYQNNPEEFDAFIDRYRKNPDNDRHQVEMLDGKPKQPISGVADEPLVINLVKYGDNNTTPIQPKGLPNTVTGEQP